MTTVWAIVAFGRKVGKFVFESPTDARIQAENWWLNRQSTDLFIELGWSTQKGMHYLSYRPLHWPGEPPLDKSDWRPTGVTLQPEGRDE